MQGKTFNSGMQGFSPEDAITAVVGMNIKLQQKKKILNKNTHL